jgi:hypothetical protein
LGEAFANTPFSVAYEIEEYEWAGSLPFSFRSTASLGVFIAHLRTRLKILGNQSFEDLESLVARLRRNVNPKVVE